jgi:NADPH:quinone reductase-like Zn-dependent oxidoreductase
MERMRVKAAILSDFGGPEVLTYGDLATPAPGPGEVLIRILAAGLNRLDHYLREGSVTREIPLPHVLGSDAVGMVEALGPGVDDVHEGDRVIAMPGYPLAEAEAAFHPLSAAPSYVIRGIAEWGAYAQRLGVPVLTRAGQPSWVHDLLRRLLCQGR